jgi:pentatricopeptide repeat protein
MRTYNTVLNALQQSNRPDVIEKAEQFFSALQSPNTVTYNTLINIYGQKKDLEKALNLLHCMQSDFQSGKNVNCCPNMRTYSTILSALQKSNRPDVIENAEKIFSAIQLPNTVTYTTLIGIYAQKGDVENALSVLHRMQSDFESGENRDCEPDMHTYSTILNALHNSNRPESVEKAEKIFNSITSPDTITYSTLLNIYASRGMANDAISLARRMQSDFDTGKNRNCRPNDRTKSTLEKALRIANCATLWKEAQDVMDWFRKRLTSI